MNYGTGVSYQGFWKGIYIFRIGNKKLEKRLQKIIKKIIKVSKVSAKSIMKSFRNVESFRGKIENSCLSLSTVVERSL